MSFPTGISRRCLAAALLAACTSAMAAPAPLSCRFEAVASGGQVRLTFTLRNTGTTEVQLLRWGSPFEGAWFAPFVTVHGAGGALPFQGALRKRGDPSAQDYLRLRASEERQAALTLDDAYALPPQGALTLKAAWRWHDVITAGNAPRPRSAHQGQEQACGEVLLKR